MPRTRLRILLTEEEIERLDSAVMESGALSRTLLVFEAIRAGLVKGETATMKKPSKRKAVPVWVTFDLKNRIKEAARANSVTQQSLVRHLLFQYIAHAPWKAHHERQRTLEAQERSRNEPA